MDTIQSSRRKSSLAIAVAIVGLTLGVAILTAFSNQTASLESSSVRRQQWNEGWYGTNSESPGMMVEEVTVAFGVAGGDSSVAEKAASQSSSFEESESESSEYSDSDSDEGNFELNDEDVSASPDSPDSSGRKSTTISSQSASEDVPEVTASEQVDEDAPEVTPPPPPQVQPELDQPESSSSSSESSSESQSDETESSLEDESELPPQQPEDQPGTQIQQSEESEDMDTDTSLESSSSTTATSVDTAGSESAEEQQQIDEPQQIVATETPIQPQQGDVSLIESMKAKLLVPHSLTPDEDNARYFPNQFLHLHHMKTGGTSMDRLIRCVMGKLNYGRLDTPLQVPYKSLHECSKYAWSKCVSGTDETCQAKTADATILSYCAPLRHLPTFGWNQNMDAVSSTITPDNIESHGFGAVTVLRNPVDRVWSMYRFQTKQCYSCRPLLDLYEEIDDNKSELTEMCQQQLVNHQVANLLSTEASIEASDESKVSEAIYNMKHFFTMIGLTEELPATVEMLHTAFPWTNRNATGRDLCELSHANASPSNNMCGPDSTHMPLPDHPDEATRAAIEAHNQLDLELYYAAVEQFQLQKQVMGLK